jgi:hypothetical protein
LRYDNKPSVILRRLVEAKEGRIKSMRIVDDLTSAHVATNFKNCYMSLVLQRLRENEEAAQLEREQEQVNIWERINQASSAFTDPDTKEFGFSRRGHQLRA